MFRTTRTIYSLALETNKLLGSEYTPPVGTTLNEKFGLLNKQTTENPTLKYYGIGISYDSLIDPNGTVSLDSIKHLPTDASLYRPLPFLLVLKDIGLTDIEENIYRLKVETEIDGVTYIACYLKLIDTIDSDSTIYDITYSDISGYNLVEYVPANHNVLSPIIVPGATLYPDNIEYVGISQKMTINLSLEEVVNIKAAADIMYPFVEESERYTIGELGFCTGVETGEQEVSYAQIAFFLKTKKLLSNVSLTTGEPIVETLEIGGMNPKVTRRDVN